MEHLLLAWRILQKAICTPAGSFRNDRENNFLHLSRKLEQSVLFWSNYRFCAIEFISRAYKIKYERISKRFWSRRLGKKNFSIVSQLIQHCKDYKMAYSAFLDTVQESWKNQKDTNMHLKVVIFYAWQYWQPTISRVHVVHALLLWCCRELNGEYLKKRFKPIGSKLNAQ